MKDWISWTSSSSVPYSSGSDGNRTTSFLIRLLLAEYGTSFRPESATKEFRYSNLPSLNRTNAVSLAPSFKTISKSEPSLKAAETVGTVLSFRTASAVVFNFGFMGLTNELLQGIERLGEAQMLDLPDKGDHVTVY